MEIVSIILTGITMSLIPNLLHNKILKLKLPNTIFLMLILLSMCLMFFGYKSINIICILIGILIYTILMLII